MYQQQKGGCPIQAVFWLEWDTTALDQSPPSGGGGSKEPTNNGNAVQKTGGLSAVAKAARITVCRMNPQQVSRASIPQCHNSSLERITTTRVPISCLPRNITSNAGRAVTLDAGIAPTGVHPEKAQPAIRPGIMASARPFLPLLFPP